MATNSNPAWIFNQVPTVDDWNSEFGGKVDGAGGQADNLVLGGVSTAPTAAPGTSTTQIASTAFVQNSRALTPQQFGAIADGVHDDAAAIQNCCAAALATGRAVHFPGTTSGYLVRTPINLTNLTASLLLSGDGIIAPANNQALSAPVRGSIVLGGTGTGHCIFDCSGSNNVVFRDLNFCTIGISSPSTIGVIFGTSTTAPSIAAPGGADCCLENVAIYMQNADSSIGLAIVGGAGPFNIVNLWSLARTPMYLSSNNTRSIASTYVTFSLGVGVDGVSTQGCALLGYATTALYMEGCSAHTWSQLYVVTIISGVGYSGDGVGIYIKNAYGINMSVECDFYPGVLQLDGTAEALIISGTAFAGTTPLATNEAVLVFFSGTTVLNCEFKLVSGSGFPSNYLYSSMGTSPTLISIKSCKFWFDTSISSNVAFFNMNVSAPTVPFFNLAFDGNADGGTFNLLINGTPAIAANERYFVNGTKFGTG